MSKIEFNGSCHCENIKLKIKFSSSIDNFIPRACDCDFCAKHSASYISDPNGELAFYIKNQDLLGKYKQGSEKANFIICKNCGVLVGVIYQESENIYSTINSKALNNHTFNNSINVSPKKLEAEEKTIRWKQLWFNNVEIK